MPVLHIGTQPGDTLEVDQHDNELYLHFAMLNGMATFTFAITKDESIKLASYIAASATGDRWK